MVSLLFLTFFFILINSDLETLPPQIYKPTNIHEAKITIKVRVIYLSVKNGQESLPIKLIDEYEKVLVINDLPVKYIQSNSLTENSKGSLIVG